MANEAPSWADQWGAGGIGAVEEDHNTVKAADANDSKKKKTALEKAKAGAMVGAQKVKSGTSVGINWVKAQCQKKSSSNSK